MPSYDIENLSRFFIFLYITDAILTRDATMLNVSSNYLIIVFSRMNTDSVSGNKRIHFTFVEASIFL